jgi:hypothetical protein
VGRKEETEPSVPLFTSWGHLQLALNLSCGSFQLDSGLAVRIKPEQSPIQQDIAFWIFTEMDFDW